MTKEDMMHVSATNNEQQNNDAGSGVGTKAGQAVGNVAKDVTVRTENRLKKGMKEFGKAAKAFTEPLKKYVMIGILVAVLVIVILILIAAAYKYLLEIDTIDAITEKDEAFRDNDKITSMNIEYLYGYKGRTSDFDEFIDTMEFFMEGYDQTFTRVASTSRAKVETTSSNERTTEEITISENENGEYCINAGLNERVDKIYINLKNKGNTLIKIFDSEEHAKESIKLWAIAEYSSQYVNLSSDPENYEHDYEADYIQGIVKVKRYSINSDGTEIATYLTYKTPEEFETLKANYKSSGDRTVFNHFTINSQDDLVIAYYKQENQTSEYTEGNADPNIEIPAEENYTTYTIDTKELNYRNAIVQYTMPYGLFVALTMYGDDADLANEIAKLIADSEMVIGIRDNVTTTVTTTYDRYLREEKIREYARVQATALETTKEVSGTFYKYILNPVSGDTSRIKESRDVEADFSANAENTKLTNISETPYYEKKKVKTEITNSVAMNIEYIDGWCFNHEMTYEAKVTDTSSDSEVAEINEEYTTTKEYNDGKITNLSELTQVNSLMQENSNLNTIRSEATENLISAVGDNILLNNINSELAKNTTLQANSTDATRVLNYYRTNNSYGSLASMIISGDSSALDNISKEFLKQVLGRDVTDTELADIKAKVREDYNSIANYYGSEDYKNRILSNSISITIVDYGIEQQERIVNKTVTTTVNTNTKQYIKISTQTIEKTSKNPDKGEENFVSILCDSSHRKAKQSLTGSASEWFFDTLEKNEDTACLIDLLRYLFYKATSTDYGVTEYDFDKGLSIIDTSNFQSIGTIVGDTVQAKIWFGLKSLGYSDMQIAAAMGNFEHEAGFITKNIENAAESTYGNDQSFTDGVNSGSISRDTFVNGKYINSKGKECIYGYGLAQWSASERKAGLYDYAKSKGVSIDDENMQVEYLIAEITGNGAEGYASRAIDESTYTTYTGTYYTAKDWYDAKDDELDVNTLNHITLAFCYTFERPAVSAESEAKRQAAALKYYNEFHGKTLSGGEYSANSTLDIVQGEFTSNITGRTFLIYDQGVLYSKGYGDKENGKLINNWCNHYTIASIASGYRGSATEISVVDATVGTSCLLSVEPATSNYLSQYGLIAESIDGEYSYSMETMKNLLKDGKYIAIYFKGETIGKSGGKYSQYNSAHWIGVLGYRVENGEEQIYVANAVSSWGNGWKNLDEFENCQSKISHFTVIKEK